MLKRPCGLRPGKTEGLSFRRSSVSRFRSRRQLDRAGVGLGIGEVEFAGFKIDIRPAQGEYLALEAAGQHQQADRSHGDG